MSDERDAERAIRKMDGLEVGRRNRPLRCQWAKVRTTGHTLCMHLARSVALQPVAATHGRTSHVLQARAEFHMLVLSHLLTS